VSAYSPRYPQQLCAWPDRPPDIHRASGPLAIHGHDGAGQFPDKAGFTPGGLFFERVERHVGHRQLLDVTEQRSDCDRLCSTKQHRVGRSLAGNDFLPVARPPRVMLVNEQQRAIHGKSVRGSRFVIRKWLDRVVVDEDLAAEDLLDHASKGVGDPAVRVRG
jgi:hypothetical protein